MMILPQVVDNVQVALDCGKGVWTVSFPGGELHLREWLWGERRRLVAASVTVDGLRAATFLDGFFELLADRPPPPAWRDRIAVACLHALGVPESGAVRSLVLTEWLAVRTFGWLPRDLDAQPAAAIDRLLDVHDPPARAAQPALPAAEEGWTRIVVLADPEVEMGDAVTESHAARDAEVLLDLRRMLQVVAQWAGLDLVDNPARSGNAPPPLPENVESPASAGSSSAETNSNASPETRSKIISEPASPVSGGRPDAKGTAGLPLSLPGTARLSRKPLAAEDGPVAKRHVVSTGVESGERHEPNQQTPPPANELPKKGSGGIAAQPDPAPSSQVTRFSSTPADSRLVRPRAAGDATDKGHAKLELPAEGRPGAAFSFPVHVQKPFTDLRTRPPFLSGQPGQPEFANGWQNGQSPASDRESPRSLPSHSDPWTVEPSASIPVPFAHGSSYTPPSEQAAFFEDSEWEERLADVLERAAVEEGIDLG